jgi:hypothetical protein
MFLFRRELDMPTTMERQLRELCLFYSIIYVKAWLSAPKTSDAPINDLSLYNQLLEYRNINLDIANAAIEKLRNHLWYLRPELAPLALFSNKLSSKEKFKIQQSINKTKHGLFERRLKLEPTSKIKNMKIFHLIDPSSFQTLTLLGLDVKLLTEQHPSTWNRTPSFQSMKTKINTIKVVNDTAERFIKLMSTYNQSQTKNEEELQDVLQVVEDHHKRVPDCSKATIVSYQQR